MSSKRVRSNKERRQFWQMVLETWQDSGMSISKFCKTEGLSDAKRAEIQFDAPFSIHTFRKTCAQAWADHLPANVVKF